MRFTSVLVLGFSTLASFATTSFAIAAVSTGENPITYPLGGSIVAGNDVTITWIVTFGKSCDLVLRKGKDSDLGKVLNIAIGISNTGAFTWSVPLTLVAGNDYSIQIIAGDNDNYSPMFTIVSDGTFTSSSPTSSSSTSYFSSSTSSSTSSSKTSASSIATTTSTSSSTTATASGASNSSSIIRTSTRPMASASSTPTTEATSVNGGIHHASPLTLVLCIFAGLMYLN